MIQAPPEVLAALIADCDRRRPEEACGLLFGPPRSISASTSASTSLISSAVPVDNVWPDATERLMRYAIDPLTQMRAERSAAAAGLDLIGFYHSHPRGPAVPSAFDRDRAWPTYLYLILGYEERNDDGRSAGPKPRVWRLDDGGAFVEHRIRIEDPT